MAVAIVQARMGSSRLPGKTLADIEGKPMLERLIERVRISSQIEEVILATTLHPRDERLVDFARRRGLNVFRGSEEDVLDRFYRAAQQYKVRDIVRVTPDCPLLDPRVMDQVIQAYRHKGCDYVCNLLGRRFPDGLDVEVFSFNVLEASWKESALPSEREHVTLYIRKHPERFRIFNVEAPEDLSRWKWSVDTAEDLEFVRSVFRRFPSGGRPFHYEDILQLPNRSPDASHSNGTGLVNEGYYRSLLKDPRVSPHSRSIQESLSLKEKAGRLIPGGSQTLSKGPSQFVQGVAPSFLVRGQGCRVWDLDGNLYLDTGMALGAVLLGYQDPEVEEAVVRQLKDGVSFSLPHPLEVELAELLEGLIPCAEMVRFGKNGSDATSGAVRLARAHTDREVVACCGYHGWQDWYIGTTSRSRGVPKAVKELTVSFEYNNLESLERIFHQYPGRVAAVILEPVGVVEPKGAFLQQVKALTEREGAVLIFDEVLTGFRFDLGGAQRYFGITPDLACFGKGIANGFPLSAIVGRRSIMQLFQEVFFSFTFGGEAISLAAAVATLKKLRRLNGTATLWSQGRKLKEGYQVLARELGLEGVTQCVGLPPRTVIQFQGKEESESLSLKSLFQQECLKRGVLVTGSQNPCLSHLEPEVDQILRVYRSALEVLAETVRSGRVAESLTGEPVQPVFRSP